VVAWQALNNMALLCEATAQPESGSFQPEIWKLTEW
jgi:hypothetical protein